MFMRDGLYLSGQGAGCLRMNSQEQSTVAWVASTIFLVADIG